MSLNRVQTDNFKNPNFGMALHMENKKVFKKLLGYKVAKNFEAARPALKEMGQDVDIFIKPAKANSVSISIRRFLKEGDALISGLDTQFDTRFNMPDKKSIIQTIASLVYKKH